MSPLLMLLLALWTPACALGALVWPAWLLSLQLGAVSTLLPTSGC